jgi:predicted methyltransferase
MTTTELLVKMVIDRWNGSIANLNKHLNALTDEQLQKEIAPGKNRGTYLLGHLIAVHDDMLILLNMGEKLYPELFEPFIKQADKVAAQVPSVAELRAMWTKQNEVLQEKFANATTEEWFEKHSAVSAEDFANEPHRNKLNIIITRTSHLQYHSGQIVLLN